MQSRNDTDKYDSDGGEPQPQQSINSINNQIVSDALRVPNVFQSERECEKASSLHSPASMYHTAPKKHEDLSEVLKPELKTTEDPLFDYQPPEIAEFSIDSRLDDKNLVDLDLTHMFKQQSSCDCITDFVKDHASEVNLKTIVMWRLAIPYNRLDVFVDILKDIDLTYNLGQYFMCEAARYGRVNMINELFKWGVGCHHQCVDTLFVYGYQEHVEYFHNRMKISERGVAAMVAYLNRVPLPSDSRVAPINHTIQWLKQLIESGDAYYVGVAKKACVLAACESNTILLDFLVHAIGLQLNDSMVQIIIKHAVVKRAMPVLVWLSSQPGFINFIWGNSSMQLFLKQKLSFAIENNLHQIMGWLLNQGLRIDSKEEQWDFVTLAVRMGSIEMLTELVEARRFFYNPKDIELARNMGFENIVHFLQRYNCNNDRQQYFCEQGRSMSCS